MGTFAGTSRTVDGVTTTKNRSHNSATQITGISTTVSTSSAVTTVLSYDANGNTSKDDLGHTLVYDAWNRLIQVKDATLTLKTYSYDATGRRVTEAAPLANPTELYYSAGWQVIEEDTGSSGVTLQSQTVYSPIYSDAIVLRDYDFNSSGGTSFTITERVYATQDANFNVTGLVTFHTLDGDANGDGTINVGELGVLATNYGKTKPGGDAAGDFSHDGKIDVTDLGILSTNYGTNSTNSGWAVAERIVYDPYGTFDVRKGSDWTAQTNEYLGWVNFHQGLRLDRDTGSKVSNAWVIGTGWYDSRGRVYSPTLGRFGQAEPSGAAYVDGMNLNWAYAGNPIRFVDPLGLQAATSTAPSDPTGGTVVKEDRLEISKGNWGTVKVSIGVTFQKLEDNIQFEITLDKGSQENCANLHWLQFHKSDVLGLKGEALQNYSLVKSGSDNPNKRDRMEISVGQYYLDTLPIVGGNLNLAVWYDGAGTTSRSNDGTNLSIFDLPGSGSVLQDASLSKETITFQTYLVSSTTKNGKREAKVLWRISWKSEATFGNKYNILKDSIVSEADTDLNEIGELATAEGWPIGRVNGRTISDPNPFLN